MQDKLDFSGLERLTPRTDSWSKVCARQDADIIPFRILSTIPLVASLILVGISVLMTAFSSSTESISINSVTSNEIADWYYNLGNDSNDDDFSTVVENSSLSYLLMEEK